MCDRETRVTPSDDCPRHEFRVYVIEGYAACARAIETLACLCDRYLAERHSIEVIDLGADPGKAVQDGVLAVPTVVRRLPEPEVRIVGDLSDTETCRRLLGMGGR